MTDRASLAFAECDLPGEPRTYDAISKRSNVPISTLNHRALGRSLIGAKARGQLYLKPPEEEAFALTVKFFETFQPKTVISCQCATGSPYHEFGTIRHAFARCISSSLEIAKQHWVFDIKVSEHYTLSVVKASHPGRYVREALPREENSLKELFRIIFTPCAEWKRKHRETANAWREFETAIKATIPKLDAYRNALPPLRGCCPHSRSDRSRLNMAQEKLDQLMDIISGSDGLIKPVELGRGSSIDPVATSKDVATDDLLKRLKQLGL